MKRFVLFSLLTACFSESTGDPLTSSSSESSGSTSASTSGSSIDGSSTHADTTTSGDAESSSAWTADPDTSGSDAGSSSSGEEPIADFALYFGGDGSLVSDVDIDLGLGTSYTIEAWVRIDSTDAHGTVVQHRGVGTSGWSLQISVAPSAFIFGFFDNNGVWTDVTSDELSNYGNGWHHLAVVRDQGMLRLYVDGAAVATAACPTGASAPTVPVQLGNGEGEALLSMAIDDLRIGQGARYDAPFEPADVLEADLSTKISLVMDEGVGSVVMDAGPDTLAFSADGTLWVAGNTEI